MGTGWNDQQARAAKGQEDSDPGKTAHKTRRPEPDNAPFRKAINRQGFIPRGKPFHDGRAYAAETTTASAHEGSGARRSLDKTCPRCEATAKDGDTGAATPIARGPMKT